MLPVCHLQGKTTEVSHGKYCSHPSPGVSPNGLTVPEARERKGEQAYVTQSQMAQTMAKVLWDNFIVHYGLPEKILLDQGEKLLRVN